MAVAPAGRDVRDVLAVPRRLGVEDLDGLVGRLRAGGRRVVGPVRGADAIELDELTGAGDLPAGWGDEQEPGRYRLRRRDDAARFGYATTATGWKRFVLAPRAPMWRAVRDDDTGWRFEAATPATTAQAFVGVRPCEVEGLARLTRVLTGGAVADPSVAAARVATVVVAVECTAPAGTCACTTMGTGPACSGEGADVVLTEVVAPGAAPSYVARAVTETGAALLDGLGSEATPEDLEAAEGAVARAASGIAARFDATRVAGALAAARADPERWEAVAARCLTCGNCTAVCPTCFCTTVVDHSGFDGREATRERVWDTCFSLEFSRLVPGPVRRTAAARYRQWITHKLSAWEEQFGESGCVGCGRCTTWCPAGIDLVAEAAAVVAGVEEVPA